MKYSRAQPLAPPTQPIALQRSKKSSKLSASRQLLARSPSWLRNKTGSSPIAFFLMAKKSPPSKSVLEDVPSDRPVAQTAKTPYQCSAYESAGFEYTFLRHGSTSELRAGNNASDHRHRPSCACFQGCGSASKCSRAHAKGRDSGVPNQYPAQRAWNWASEAALDVCYAGFRGWRTNADGRRAAIEPLHRFPKPLAILNEAIEPESHSP
jgi:hypothetical protein